MRSMSRWVRVVLKLHAGGPHPRPVEFPARKPLDSRPPRRLEGLDYAIFV